MYPLEDPMTFTTDRLKFASFTLLIALGIALAYIVLHEGGHALAGLAFGGRIREVDLNFFNLGAHVNIDGKFTRFQDAVINISGVGLPALVWLVLILTLPKESSPLVLWTKFMGSAGTLCSLLAWIVIPFFYLRNDAPASDDVTRLLANSGLPPLGVAFVALAFFVGGWFLFVRRYAGMRLDRHGLFKGGGKSVQAWRWVMAGGVIAAALIGAGMLVTSTLGDGLPKPLKGFDLADTVDLSTRNVETETIAKFNLPRAGDVAIFIRVTGTDPHYTDVAVAPSQGPALLLLYSEDVSIVASDWQKQYRLPAGDYGIVLTSRKSSGMLKVYFLFP